MIKGRKADERLLKMLEMRQSGRSCTLIARKFKIAASSVARMTTAVKNADEAHERRPLSEGYW